MSVTIIGVDCATQPKNVGLARGIYTNATLRVDKIAVNQPLVETIATWLPTDDSRTLLALDAPLGWPLALSTALATHQAGERLTDAPNQLFRRETDRFVKTVVGKQSLDVGADRIARTAHATLTLLAALSQELERLIPLAWEPTALASLSAIEVYPAATLKVLFGDERVLSYKGKGRENGRLAILEHLQTELTLPTNHDLLRTNDDALDAVIAVLAGVDFLQGKAMPPTDIEIAKKEGWMWIRQPFH
ncbi:MAG: DUF429 domain-containing protein [Chloroflexota bacterium]